MEKVYSTLTQYMHLEQLSKATSVLELSLWEAGIDCFEPSGQEERDVCRVHCGRSGHHHAKCPILSLVIMEQY